MNKNNVLKRLLSFVASFRRPVPIVVMGVVMSLPLSAFANPYNYESLPGSAIADHECTEVSFPVADSFVVSDLNVGVNLSHTYRGDLTIRLSAPDGTEATLFNRQGFSGDNLDISLGDEHASPISNIGSGIHDVTAPFFEHEYRPDNDLDVFNGLSANGNWVLRVCDGAGGATGTVNRVSLNFTGSVNTATIAGTVPRAFEERQTVEFKGNFEYVGNTLLHCVSGCVADNHNQSPMTYVDIDGDSSTFNSSSATVSLPADAEVTWAGLYWGGVAGVNTSVWPGVTNTANVAQKSSLRLKAPGDNYQTVVADVIDTISNDPTNGWSAYQAFADVTDIVQSRGAGDYTVANVQLDYGGGSPTTAFTGPNGGWNLVVFYRADSEKYRRITIWDGYDFIYFSAANHSFVIDSILTPPVAGFETEVAFTCYDGEVTDGQGGGSGDFVALSNEANKLSNATNPSTNVCNGSITKNGSNVVSRSPAAVQNWGFDVDRFSSSSLSVNADSVTAIFGSDHEGIWFGNLILSSEVFAPPVAEKSFANSVAVVDAVQEMTISLQNTNAAGSLENISFTDTYPAGLSNIGSNVIKENTCGGNLTANAYSGSLSFSGGTLNAGDSCKMTVRVYAQSTLASTSVENCTGLISTSSTGSKGASACASVLVTSTNTDYGDAPASYGDAAHTIDSSLYLGDTVPDGESGSQYSYNAYGDGYEVSDGSGTWYRSGDEDGAPSQPISGYIPLFPVLKETATSYSVDFKVNNAKSVAAMLYGWIDFDHDGVFSTDEAASVTVPAASSNGSVTLNWDVPADIALGTTFIRLRLTTDSNVTTATPTGVASDGEVEDFALAVALDIPPNSDAISITTGETPLACQSIVFSDDFDDLATGDFIGPNRGGVTFDVRDWTINGGGSDTYARTLDGTQFGLGTSIYLGNGAVRRVSPEIVSGLEFDANGRMTTPLDAVELRDDVDDKTPGVTLSSGASISDWGPEPVTLSRSFATEVGKSYRLYFKALPEDVGGNFVAGTMRLDLPGGSLHFKIPSSNEGPLDYSVEFTAVNTTSTISFVNYGHILPKNSGWCDPVDSPWCTVGGGDGAGNELILDNVAVTESACTQGEISGVVYVDRDADNNYSSTVDTALSDISVSLFNDTTGDLVSSTSTGADGSYSFANLENTVVYRVRVDDSDSDLPGGAVSGTPNPLAGLDIAGSGTLSDQNFGFDLSGDSCPAGYIAENHPGYASSVLLDQGVSREEKALGKPADVGTNPDTANGGVGIAAGVGTGDRLIVDLGRLVKAGSEMEFSLTRDNAAGRVEIATSVDNVTYDVLGTYGNSGTLSAGTEDSLERITLTAPVASARYVRFTNQAGMVWVDAISYSNVCTAPVSLSSCGPVMTSIMPSGAIDHADNVNRTSVFSFDYNLRGTSVGLPDPIQLASASEVGTVWGKAYDENNKVLYTSAFLRRHAGLSPHGLGAIYRIDEADANHSSLVAEPVLWMDLNSQVHLGAGATLFPSETPANRGLTGAFEASRDIWAYNKVGKQGIGGLDISDDFSTLYAVDMTNRQLLVIDIGTKTVLARHAINDPGCAGGAGDVRPFGVDYLKGDVYVGVTCSGETNRSNSEVDAYVVKLSNGTFTPVVNGARGVKWPEFWDDSPFMGGTCSAPTVNRYVPVITNMQLDENDNMIIGVTSINGFRFGNRNYLPDLSCQTLLGNHETYGYVIRATPAGDDGWVLSPDELHDGSYGDGFRHFFSDGQYAHWGIGASHSFLGGLAVSRCEGPEVAIVNLMDALTYESAGTRYMRTADGQQETATSVGDISLETSTDSTLEHYRGIGSTWEKSSGMGDIEFMSTPDVAVETGGIYGKVYLDSNGNDVYDSATESVIGAITVTLLNDADGSTIATTSTATDGSYGFTHLDATVDYRVQVDTSDPDLPVNSVIGTTNPLTGVSVSAGLVTSEQNFGFDLEESCSTIVTTTADSDNASNNSGSLRDAIECANETAGPDTITFNMPTSESGYDAGTGVWTISPASQLPTVTGADTVIGATTQSGSVCGDPWAGVSGRILKVQLDGAVASAANTYIRGLDIQADGFALKGMSVTNFLPGVGVYTQSDADNSRFTCNHLGVAADGMTAGSNSVGMDLRGRNAQLGDVGAGDGNIISGNSLGDGVGVVFNGANNSHVYNNFFGVGLDGETVVANKDGIVLGSSSDGISIGGSHAGEANLIAGNTGRGIGSAVGNAGEYRRDNKVIGNLIGLDKGGVKPLPNQDGIALQAVRGFLIQENSIANNTRWGIMLQNSADDVVISRNSIYNNGSLGIDLQSHDGSSVTSVGVTPNDEDDVDEGANGLLNFPELNVISHSGKTVTYDFDLDVAAGSYRVEFFDNPSGLDSTGHGEGKVYLGSVDITHAGNGSQNFTGNFVATQAPSADTLVVTTVTSKGGAGETSEFSGRLDNSCSLVVTTTADSDSANNNSGSLRDAIECANATEGPDTIIFNIPTTEPGYTNPDGVAGNADDYWSIRPTRRLPFIRDPLVIAADTQPGYVNKPVIELDGSNAGSVEGLFLTTGSDGSTLRALIVNRFRLSGIELRNSSGHTVVGSYIGTDSSGLADLGNGDHGIEIADGSGSNTIGGVNVLDGNVIAANKDSGIRIDGSGANTIQGNLIGLGSDGQIAMGNKNDGLYIRTSGNQIGGSSDASRNVIADNVYNGINLFNGSDNVIVGNYIGTDSTGTRDRGNHIYGIKLTTADSNTIGGVDAGNLISGNGHDGIMIQSSDSNTVQGNSIGTDATGALALGNTGVGITVRDSESNQIGGLATGEGNLISANSYQGIWVRDNTSRLNRIQGNVIGAGTDGAALGNGTHGVGILSAIETDVSQNKVAHNGHYGVFLQDGAVTNKIVQNTISENTWAGIANDADSNNTFSRNSISGNGGLGIDLGLDGVTENSNVDAWLNYPEIGSSSSISTNGTMIVAYDFDLDVPANAAGYRVEFFSNTTVDPSLHGEGETYLGHIDITHQGAGSEKFKGSFNANQAVPENANIALTLTKKLDALTLGDTSEFSGIRNGGLSVCSDLLADPSADMADIVLNENSSDVTYLEALDASGNPITYVISGGADGRRFVIEPAPPGALFDCVTIRFINDRIIENRDLSVVRFGGPSRQPPPGDYEAPIDTGNDNVYDLEITATDSQGNTVTKPLSIVVQDVNERPFITSAPRVDFLERQDVSVVVMDLQSYDPDASDTEGSGLSYSIAGGVDADHFTVDSQTGELRFVKSPDYGLPADSNGDNKYELIVRVTDDQGLAGKKSVTVTVTDDPDKSGVRVNIKALLQGPYDRDSGLMSNNLASLGFLPSEQPYAPEPFNYQGAETLDFENLELADDETVVDWVLVELRNSAEPTQVVAARAALIKRNGDVDNVNQEGAGLVLSDIPPGEYYVSLRHRNHLGVMTATPLPLSMSSALIDFSSPDTPVYGDHARLSDGNIALLWSGDVNQDNRLILNGQGSDLNPMLAAVLTAPGNAGFNSSYQLSGYHAADLNMDGSVVFMGPSNDANVLLGNTLAHPGNINFSGNFIVVGGMP